jgi:hypothetical protein
MKPCGCGGTVLFRVPRDGEFSLKIGPDETKPLDWQQSKGRMNVCFPPKADIYSLRCIDPSAKRLHGKQRPQQSSQARKPDNEICEYWNLRHLGVKEVDRRATGNEYRYRDE